MSRVIFDIETIGVDFDALDEKSKEYLVKFAENEEELEEIKQKLALWAVTGEVITIGMLNPETERGVVYYRVKDVNSNISNNNSNISNGFDDVSVKYVEVEDEKELLDKFWEDIRNFEQFITFNGRGFDCPFLILRSGILGVKVTRDLMPYRYDSRIHVDLLEQFTFYSAVRKFSLDFYCKAFGIESPKEGGITGLDIGDLYKEGKCLEIAEYCYKDLRATEELWRRWEGFIYPVK